MNNELETITPPDFLTRSRVDTGNDQKGDRNVTGRDREMSRLCVTPKENDKGKSQPSSLPPETGTKDYESRVDTGYLKSRCVNK